MDGSNKLVKTAGQWQRSEVRTQRCVCCILIVPFSLIQILYKYTTQIGPPFFFFSFSFSFFLFRLHRTGVFFRVYLIPKT